MLKLNSIRNEVFELSRENDRKVHVNSGDHAYELSRNEIIAVGRLVACEFIGKHINAIPDEMKGEKYASRLNGVDYATLAQKHRDQKLLFCAAQANKMVGKDAPNSIEDVRRDSSYGKNELFLRTMAAIDREILDPIFFSVISDVGMQLMEWTAAPLGQTTEIDIRSNDIFLFEDSAPGSGRSTSKNYLYGKTVTVTPKVYSCNATIKWYQDVVNGDAGRYYAAIMNGMYNKIYAIMLGRLQSATSAYVPSGLTAATYSTANWTTLTDLVAAANGIRYTDLMAVGTRAALQNLYPVDGSGGAITGFMYGLGREWFTNGYLANAGGVDLFPITPVIVPGTQNSTLATLDTGNNIYIIPKAGFGYAPMRGVYAEGSPITLTASISDTADFTIDINVEAFFDIIPLFASKIGVMQSVYPSV